MIWPATRQNQHGRSGFGFAPPVPPRDPGNQTPDGSDVRPTSRLERPFGHDIPCDPRSGCRGPLPPHLFRGLPRAIGTRSLVGMRDTCWTLCPFLGLAKLSRARWKTFMCPSGPQQNISPGCALLSLRSCADISHLPVLQLSGVQGHRRGCWYCASARLPCGVGRCMERSGALLCACDGLVKPRAWGPLRARIVAWGSIDPFGPLASCRFGRHVFGALAMCCPGGDASPSRGGIAVNWSTLGLADSPDGLAGGKGAKWRRRCADSPIYVTTLKFLPCTLLEGRLMFRQTGTESGRSHPIWAESRPTSAEIESHAAEVVRFWSSFD